MRWCVVLLALAVCGCGHAATAGSRDSTPAGTVVSGHGIAVTLPSGWHVVVLRGRTEIQNYDGNRDPRVGNVRAFLDEFSQAFANDGMPYPKLDGALRIHPGDYPSATFATEADQRRDISGAARFFTESGRRFELLVQYGGKPAPQSTVSELNHVLATVAIQPGDFYPGTLDPPTFSRIRGWAVGRDAPTHARPEGDQLCAWASTIPYRDPQACPIPSYTIDALPHTGIVISTDASRDWSTLPTGDPLPHH